MTRRRRVAITGVGLVTPVGNDVATTWAAVLEGGRGLRDTRDGAAHRLDGDECVRRRHSRHRVDEELGALLRRQTRVHPRERRLLCLRRGGGQSHGRDDERQREYAPEGSPHPSVPSSLPASAPVPVSGLSGFGPPRRYAMSG